MISTLILAAIILLNVFLLLLLLKSSRTNKAVLYFSSSIFFIILWTISIFLTELDSAEIRVIWWSRLSFLFPIFMILLLIPFTFLLPPKNTRDKIFSKNNIRASYILYIAGLFFAYTSLTPLIIERVVNLKSTFGPLQPIYSVYLFVGFMYIIYLLYQGHKKSSGRTRAQFFYMLIGIAASSLIAIFTNLLIPLVTNLEIRFLGPLGLLFFITFTSYSIITHHLFDIRIIIRRTVVYSVLLAFVLGVYSAVIFASTTILGNPQDFGSQNIIPNLIAAILIAIGFEPLRKYLTRITDKYLFKGDYDPQEILKQLSKNLVAVLALDEALTSMMDIVTKAMRLTHAAVIIINAKAEEDDLMRIQSVGYQPDLRAKLLFTAKNPLIQYMVIQNSLTVIEEMERRLEDEKLSNEKVRKLIRRVKRLPIHKVKETALKEQVVAQAKDLEIALLVPIFVRSRVIGIFCLGPKLSGDSFTDSDLKTLEIISGQTASAIEQARLYEEDQTKSEFVSIASHELLTPTSAIEGYLSMILEENMAKVDDKARKYLERVYFSAKRLSNLVKDLLSVSRIEAGRIKVNVAPTQIEPIIEAVTEDFIPQFNNKRISLNYLKTDKPLPRVMVDSDKLQEIMINLIGNALKYTKEGSALVTAVAKRNRAEIAVEDSGVGIRDSDLPHLFEKFYRVDNTETVGIVGSGLGLYITKSILELMNGSIRVESTEWKGSRFIVTLPLAKKAS